MTTQDFLSFGAVTRKLRATVLNEIFRSNAGQLEVDELGIAIATHLGTKRSRNEDRIAVVSVVAANGEQYTAAIVCDGVGGSELGDEAASLTIASIVVDLALEQELPRLKDLAVKLVKRGDALVRKELLGRGSSTLAMLLGTPRGDVICANVGDSRAYSWSPSTRELRQITVDDTIENELRDLPGNPDALIKARGLKGRLSQAIGESGRSVEELRIQTYEGSFFPEGALLGSDGMWRAARDFEAVMVNTSSPINAVKRGVALAGWVGGVDNASLIAISDVAELCRDRGGSDYQASQRQTMITLWLTNGRVNFFANSIESEARPTEPKGKPRKQKGSAKKKSTISALERLESEPSKPHPKAGEAIVKVTIEEDSDVNHRSQHARSEEER
ncbi:MAG: protein phosphatase 2C domain-containing protein [Xanthomonadales bacterium]|nr:protein phosphatase 2C domain-containing protein [Xanthomonadales bacterium]